MDKSLKELMAVYDAIFAEYDLYSAETSRAGNEPMSFEQWLIAREDGNHD